MRIIINTSLILSFLLLVPGGLSQTTSTYIHYKTYSNARFAFSISYPAGLLIPEPESENGDGRRFVTKDGKAVLTTYGSHNALDETIDSLYKSELESSSHPDRRITYKVRHSTWFVVSGYEGDKIFYVKTLIRGDIIKTFRFEYDKSLKPEYDHIVSRIARSFRG